jgi:hypothetical protein
MDLGKQAQEVDQNFDYFQRNLTTYLREHSGAYVLLKECKEHGFFESPGLAYRAGQARFIDGIFSIQEITDEPIDLGFFSHAGY